MCEKPVSIMDQSSMLADGCAGSWMLDGLSQVLNPQLQQQGRSWPSAQVLLWEEGSAREVHDVCMLQPLSLILLCPALSFLHIHKSLLQRCHSTFTLSCTGWKMVQWHTRRECTYIFHDKCLRHDVLISQDAPALAFHLSPACRRFQRVSCWLSKRVHHNTDKQCVQHHPC